LELSVLAVQRQGISRLDFVVGAPANREPANRHRAIMPNSSAAS